MTCQEVDFELTGEEARRPDETIQIEIWDTFLVNEFQVQNVHSPDHPLLGLLLFYYTLFLLEARCVCRQAAVKAAKFLPPDGVARSKQDPINCGHGAQYLCHHQPAGAKLCLCGGWKPGSPVECLYNLHTVQRAKVVARHSDNE